VVGEPSEALLRDALARLSTDVGLRKRLSANALETAERNHDANRIVPIFKKSIS
jgi:hypothetical protein